MNTRDMEEGEAPAHLWINVGRNVGANVLYTLVATGLISLAVAIIVALSRVNSENAIAFRILLGSAIVGALVAALSLVGQAAFLRRVIGRNQTAAELNRTVLERLESLGSRLPSIDWSYDTSEHDRRIYQRICKVIENPSTHEFKVLTIIRDPALNDISETQREAIREYHRSLEVALQGRSGFTYERLVVLRTPFRRRRSARDLLADLVAGRPEYVDHYRRVCGPLIIHAEGARADIRFYADTGRLFDLAFAVALDKDRKPITLLLEIGVTRPSSDVRGSGQHPVTGILALENPDQQLADAFLLAHQALRLGSTSVESLSEKTVRDAFRLNDAR